MFPMLQKAMPCKRTVDKTSVVNTTQNMQNHQCVQLSVNKATRKTIQDLIQLDVENASSDDPVISSIIDQ